MYSIDIWYIQRVYYEHFYGNVISYIALSIIYGIWIIRIQFYFIFILMPKAMDHILCMLYNNNNLTHTHTYVYTRVRTFFAPENLSTLPSSTSSASLLLPLHSGEKGVSGLVHRHRQRNVALTWMSCEEADETVVKIVDNEQQEQSRKREWERRVHSIIK